jgi:hypothetical protein
MMGILTVQLVLGIDFFQLVRINTVVVQNGNFLFRVKSVSFARNELITIVLVRNALKKSINNIL